MTKYYKLNRWYFRHTGTGITQKVMAYSHEFGVVNSPSKGTIEPSDEGTIQITEAQYNRIKKLVLAKLLKD